MDKKPITYIGKNNSIVIQQLLKSFEIKHEFLIKIDYSCVKSINKLSNLCEKFPPKIIIMEHERKCNNTLGISYDIPTTNLKLIY